MRNLKNISNTFDETLKGDNLQNVTVGITEALIDGSLDGGLLKDIPILGSLVGIGKFGMQINDLLFLKKVAYFFTEIKDIDFEKRIEMISKIDNSKKERIKVGEKLLYIIDKSEDHIKAEYQAKLFKAFINEVISYSTFLRCSSIIQKLIIEDLELFLSIDNWDDRYKEHEGLEDFDNNLVNAGICLSETLVENFAVRDQDDWKASEKYIVEGGETFTDIYITNTGETIKEVLG